MKRSNGFWDIEYPERTAATLGARKPRAQVEVSPGERIPVPICVARKLEADEGEEPQSRAERLFRIKEASRACAVQRVAEMASRREYATQEAVSRLVRDGYSKAVAEAAVARAVELRLLDDARFSESFVRSKVACGWGPMRIGRELSRWGLSLDEVPGWPEEFTDGADDLDRARELLATKRVPERNPYPRLVRFLASRGYPLSVARRAVSERLEEEV